MQVDVIAMEALMAVTSEGSTGNCWGQLQTAAMATGCSDGWNSKSWTSLEKNLYHILHERGSPWSASCTSLHD